MKIYTKTGDEGTTSLYGGERRSKSNIRVHSYGEVDELQAVIGVALAHLTDDIFIDVVEVLTQVQWVSFTICAELARTETEEKRKDPVLQDSDILYLESAIDTWESELAPLRAFILQGGSVESSFLHLARAVSRRAERAVVELATEESVDPKVLQYLNRFSDLLFVAARIANHRLEQPDIEWHPRIKR